MDMDILKEILRRRKMQAAEKLSEQVDGDTTLMEKKEVIIGDPETQDASTKDGDSKSTDELAPSKKELKPEMLAEEEDESKEVVDDSMDDVPKPFGRKEKVDDGGSYDDEEDEKPKKKSTFSEKMLAGLKAKKKA